LVPPNSLQKSSPALALDRLLATKRWTIGALGVAAERLGADFAQQWQPTEGLAQLPCLAMPSSFSHSI
jgi:hypothetical protein